MKTIVYKNGHKMEITQEVANIIYKNMIKNKINAVNHFENFMDEDQNIIQTINVSEITCIQ